MSSDPSQRPDPAGETPPYGSEQAHPVPSAQEVFPPFPEQPARSSPSYMSPAFYEAVPDQAPPNFPPAQPVYGNLPPYGYGLPQQIPYGMASPRGPLPLGEAIRQLPRQYWRVFTHPKATTFLDEQGKAAWNIIWFELLILTIAEILGVLLLLFVEFLLLRAFLPSMNTPMVSLGISIVAAVLVIGCLIVVPMGFFMGAGIYHLVAKAFGGQGNFLSYCYSYGLIIVPISIVSLALSVIPCIGSLAVLAGSVYEIILLIHMTMGVHRLSGGKASAAILIPVCTGIALVVALYVVYLVWIFSIVPHS